MPLSGGTSLATGEIPARRRCGALMRVMIGILLLSPAACDHDPVGRTVPAKGKVTLNGKPLRTGSVAFWPDAENGNAAQFEAGAQIDKEGGFELITHGKRGALPGAYLVTVTAQAPIDQKNPYARAELLVPEAYTKKDSTPLRVTIVDNPPGPYELAVKQE